MFHRINESMGLGTHPTNLCPRRSQVAAGPDFRSGDCTSPDQHRSPTYDGERIALRYRRSASSYQICSYSNLSQKIMVGRCCGRSANLSSWHLILTFIKPMSFFTRKLAYVIDSLVRVTRRVNTSRCGRTYFLRPAYCFEGRFYRKAGLSPN